MEDLRPILTSPYDYVISDPKWIQTGIFKTTTHVYQLVVNNYILKISIVLFLLEFSNSRPDNVSFNSFAESDYR